MTDPILLCELFDLYASVLTDRQRDAFSLRYAEDLSLSEIAEELSISRQGARDAILHAEDALLKAEAGMGIHSKLSVLRRDVSALEQAVSALPDAPETEALHPLLAALRGHLEED